MENKKYILTNETIEFKGHTLHRIQAVRDFGNVKAGDKGGFIEGERNLSHDGNCWVYHDAKVYGNACVYDNVKVCDNALICDKARIFSKANIHGSATVSGEAVVSDNAIVHDYAQIFSYAKIYDNAVIYEEAEIGGLALIYGNAKIGGHSYINHEIPIGNNAEIYSKRDYIIFKNWWSSGRFFTWTRSDNMWSVGCFFGTGEQLIKKAYKDSELSGREYERVVKYVESILADEEKDNQNK